jgi:hypothetical protein
VYVTVAGMGGSITSYTHMTPQLERALLHCPAYVKPGMGSVWVEDYGAEPNPTGNPIGGGKGYSRIVTGGDVVVGTGDELLSALEGAQAGEVVYVAPDAEIDLTGHFNIVIPAGVTLAGNRGQEGTPGPLLFSTQMPSQATLFSAGPRTRVTGLRIRGMDPDFPDVDYDRNERSWTRAITAAGGDMEVDNCELSNFHHSGVCVQGRNVHVHHCHIHDVHMYAVLVADEARLPVLIEANRIHWASHIIAGTGGPNTGYEARHNICVREKLPASRGLKHKSHGFAMHQWRPVGKSRGQLIAADRVLIHHNTLLGQGSAFGVCIEGVPREIADIHKNWFSQADPMLALRQPAPPGNLWIHDNAYGPERNIIRVGPQTTPQILFRSPAPPDRKPVKVADQLPLEVAVRACKRRSITRVTVALGEKEIYAGEAAPEPGQVSIDRAALSAEASLLTVTATDNQGATATHSVWLLRE